MPLLREEAAKLSVEQMERGVIEEFIERDALWEFLPFMRVNSKAYVYNREGTLATGDWLDPNDTITPSASTFEQKTAYLKILIGDVDVDKFLDATYADHNDQLATQIAMKAKGMARQYKNALVNGTDGGNPETSQTWNGLKRIAETNKAGQVIGLGNTGANLTLSMLDELAHAVTNGADAFMMNSQMFRKMKDAWRAAGGNTGGMLQIGNFGLSVPQHDGMPIIVNDYILQDQGDGGDCSNIYAIRFNESDCLQGIYGGANAGFNIEDLGTVQNKDSTRTRLKFYNGMCLKSSKSLAVLQNVK